MYVLKVPYREKNVCHRVEIILWITVKNLHLNALICYNFMEILRVIRDFWNILYGNILGI